MIPERLRAIEDEIRKAVARRQLGDLPERLGELRVVADKHIAGLPESDPARLAIVRHVLATIEWARLMLVTQRQTLSAELALLPKVGRYLDRADFRTRTMCLDL